jgi:octaprenyl-diphosphate synthase
MDLDSESADRAALGSIRARVQDDLRAVDEAVRTGLNSLVPLVDQVAEHIIGGGGKRLRPLLVVLAGRACGGQSSTSVQAAAFIEFIHTATLLHDDVVDNSARRRGRDTANEIYGNQASVCWSAISSIPVPSSSWRRCNPSPSSRSWPTPPT